MALLYKLSVPNGKYQKDGQDKTSWLNVGAIMDTKSGGLVMKLDAIPTHVMDKEGNSVPFNGWINVFTNNQDSNHSPNAPQQSQNQTGGIAMPSENPAPYQGDSIPF